MTPAELKYLVQSTGSYFFTRQSMKFFGDTMKNFRCRDGGDCWILYRKNPVKHGLNSEYYFSKTTYQRIHK